MKTSLIILAIGGMAAIVFGVSRTPAVMATPIADGTPTGNIDEGAVELGLVNWGRDLEAAKKQSAETNRPLFVQFQEVPGCSTCQNYGRQVLSHPLLVEAIETEFIPVLIYNNKQGQDETLLKKFNEPAWNNPVVRYLNSNGSDIIDRADNIWTPAGTAQQMVAALKSAKRTVPAFLELTAQTTTDPKKLQTAEFAMHCYWEGEAKLATLEGVNATRSGWRDNLEVVQLQFDPDVVDYSKLLAAAQQFECASKIYAHTEGQLKSVRSLGSTAVDVQKKPEMRVAKLSDQKYFLRNSRLRHLPLTALQASKINGSLYTRKEPQVWLSPKQIELLRLVETIQTSSPDWFDEFVWPDNDDQLAEFAARLKKRIESHPSTKR